MPSRILWAVEQLAPGADERILEIGCGSGLAAARVCEQLRGGRLVALDRSAAAVASAQRSCALWLEGGRMEVHGAALAAFDAPDASFDAALAVNVNVFWRRADAELSVLHRLVRPGGRLCLVFQPPAASKLAAIAAACEERLTRHRFRDVRVAEGAGAPVPMIAIHAERARR